MPRTYEKTTAIARKIPSVRPRGFLENIYPIISLESKAKANAKIMGRFVMNPVQKSP